MQIMLKVKLSVQCQRHCHACCSHPAFYESKQDTLYHPTAVCFKSKALLPSHKIDESKLVPGTNSLSKPSLDGGLVQNACTCTILCSPQTHHPFTSLCTTTQNLILSFLPPFIRRPERFSAFHLMRGGK